MAIWGGGQIIKCRFQQNWCDLTCNVTYVQKKNTFIVLSVFFVKERGFCNKNIAQMGSWVDWYKRIHFFDISFFRGNITFLAFSTTPSLSQGCTFFTTWSGMTNCFSILKKKSGWEKRKVFGVPFDRKKCATYDRVERKNAKHKYCIDHGHLCYCLGNFPWKIFSIVKKSSQKIWISGKKKYNNMCRKKWHDLCLIKTHRNNWKYFPGYGRKLPRKKESNYFLNKKVPSLGGLL